MPVLTITVQLHIDPSTGREELVVVGGYSGNELAPMVPFALDLQSFTWRRGPWAGCLQHVGSRLPKPRQRAACMRVGHWLLVHGGATANVRVSAECVLC